LLLKEQLKIVSARVSDTFFCFVEQSSVRFVRAREFNALNQDSQRKASNPSKQTWSLRKKDCSCSSNKILVLNGARALLTRAVGV
jgi:hypothetical protein